jgi:hypothetical protein
MILIKSLIHTFAQYFYKYDKFFIYCKQNEISADV